MLLKWRLHRGLGKNLKWLFLVWDESGFSVYSALLAVGLGRLGKPFLEGGWVDAQQCDSYCDVWSSHGESADGLW